MIPYSMSLNPLQVGGDVVTEVSKRLSPYTTNPFVVSTLLLFVVCFIFALDLRPAFMIPILASSIFAIVFSHDEAVAQKTGGVDDPPVVVQESVVVPELQCV
jgi:hypothetical protein